MMENELRQVKGVRGNINGWEISRYIHFIDFSTCALNLSVGFVFFQTQFKSLILIKQ